MNESPKKRASGRAILQLIKDAVSDWSDDKASVLAASLAYYSAISLAPLLIIVLGIAGLAFGRDAATGRLLAEFQHLIGEQSARAIQDIVANAHKPGTGIASTIVGTVILLFGASGVFGAL